MAEVSFQHISKSFGSTSILQGVDLTVQSGEFLVLVGPSGCGKSTLLRILAGLEEPTEGRVLIGDRDVTRLDPRHRNVAMVFQNYALYPHLTVRENLAFSLEIQRTPSAEVRKRVEEIAELLRIHDYLERKPKQLSGGQRQRVALGRALVRKAPVLLFDEPLSNLDAALRSRMRAEIKRLHGILKNTVVYVTHDQTEATTLGDRIAVLNKGMIQQIDRPEVLFDRPANRFVAGFIGTPEMNFFRGRLAARGGRAEFRSSAGSFSIPWNQGEGEREVEIGIRPEDLAFTAAPSPSGALSGHVEFEEFLGHQRQVFLDCGGTPVRVLSPQSHATGSAVMLSPDVQKIHVFTEKGVRLC